MRRGVGPRRGNGLPTASRMAGGGSIIPNPFDYYTIPLEEWIDIFVTWVRQYRDVFETVIKDPVDVVLAGIQWFLVWLHPVVFLLLLGFIAWRIAGWRVAAFSVVAMTFLGFLDLWTLTMETLATVLCALAFCAAVGLPLGIIAARNDTFEAAIRPVLDVMQTIPTFVYLVPVAMLIGIGAVPGVIATIVFALPPVIRLTNLGIRQVPLDVVEASYAFGSTSWQTLKDVQVPLAMRTIMAGMNQTLLLSLSMVVIASIIGADGLGRPVRQGLNNLQPGLAAVGGVGIVVLAIVLDRITQALGRGNPGGGQGALLRILTTFFGSRRIPDSSPDTSPVSNVPSEETTSPREEATR